MITSGLLLLADARFPAGGHVHSAGVEAAVAIGDVRDRASVERYLHARLASTGLVDAAFAAATVAALDDPARLDRLDDEYAARTPSPYLREVSRRLGRQLLRTTSQVWPAGAVGFTAHPTTQVARRGVHQPIALGIATASAGGEPADAAALAVHHLAGAVTTAATRLLGLDPVAMAALQARVAREATTRIISSRCWEVADPADLPAHGGCLTEILGEHHGSLDARLFAV